MNMKLKIIFPMYVIRVNFDHVGRTSSSVSGELRQSKLVQTERTQRKGKVKKDVQTLSLIHI